MLDRDGVINEEPGPILSPEQFIMIPKSAAAIARLNKMGWRCFVVTNQSALARGELNLFTFQKITEKMHLELEKYSAYIDGQYYCPHHPDWKDGKLRKVSKICSCRKPGTSLLEQASKEHGFSQDQTVLIGDSTSDFAASSDWGACSIGVRTGHGGKDGKVEAKPDFWKDDLWSAVEFVIKNSTCIES